MYTLKLLKVLLLCFGGVFLSAKVVAQSEQHTTLTDFAFVKQSNVRLNSQNPTGLSYLPVEKISKAVICSVYEKGKLINYYQSDNSLKGQLEAESYYRITPQIVMHGLVSYQYFEGKNMGGSAFVDPTITPFDIVEYNDTNRGYKQKETYHLLGGISYEAISNLKIGANIDYTAINFAKRKDLHHRNKVLDLEVTAGLSYPVNNSLEIGANYYYRKRVEGLYFNIYGTTDKSYASLIDYGTFFGRTEGFTDTGDGYTSGKTERPLVDNYHGAATQINWHILPSVTFHNELFFKKRIGYYGVKSSSSVVYSNHSADIIGYNGAISINESNNLHNIRFRVEQDKLSNFENVYNIINIEGAQSQVEYYGDNQMLDQENIKATASYDLYLGINNYVPKYEFNLTIDLQNRNRTTSLYPYYRKQDLTFGTMSAKAKRNIVKGKNIYSMGVGLSFATGNGDAYIDGTYAQPSSTEKAPKTTHFNLNYEYEYLTTNRFEVNPTFRYTRTLVNNQSIFAQLAYSIEYAPEVDYLSHSRHTIMLSVGVGF